MKATKVNWLGIVVGALVGALLYFIVFLLIIPNWGIFP